MQLESQSCNSCDCEITKSQRSLTCNICSNHYHCNRHCLRLASDDLLVTDNEFTCYQCVDTSLPFHSVDDNSFRASIETSNSELLERNIINNLAEFNPYRQEVLLQNDRDMLDLPDENIQHTSGSNFYSSIEFNNLINAKHLNSGELSFLHLNIRSIRNKFDALTNYLNSLDHKFAIIALTETWLNVNDNDNFEIPGYKSSKLIRRNKIRRGICIFTRDDLKVKLRDDLVPENNTGEMEALFIEIINERSKNIIVGMIYKPPNNRFNNFDNDLKTILTKLDKWDKPCYIMGDFNINLLKYDCCNFANHFFNQLSSSGYMPLITKPTRITKSTATLIDNIFTNNLSRTEHSSGILINDISDHLPIFTITEYNILDQHGTMTESNRYSTRKISTKSLESFSRKLQSFDWRSVLSKNDPTESYTVFLEEFFGLYDRFFPIKNNKSNSSKRSNNQWISKGLKKSSKRKEALYKKFLKNPTQQNEQAYKRYRNKLNHLIRIAKKRYYSEKFSQARNDTKSTWNTINDLLGRKKSCNALPRTFLNNNNDEVSDPKLIANEFNDFFVNVGPNLAKKFSRESDEFYKFLKGSYNDSMFLYNTNCEEITKVIDKMACKSSCGVDGISSKVVKYVAQYISIPLSHIFNLTFTTGKIPNDMKVALVTPVYKASEQNVFSNYRPISVLPCFSKILEKLMYKRLIDYINKHDILTSCQYGFRSKHSTNHAIIELVDKITKAIENNEFTVGIFLDLSKAFDTVNHSILLKKLYFYGIRGKCHSWIADYLSNRKQIVKYNDVRSSEMTITCGVPQGSILGPLLFLIYINDLNNSTSKLSAILFADDTNLFCSGKDLQELESIVNTQLTGVQEWLTLNQLTLNIKKSKFIIFKSHKKQLKRQLHLQLSGNDLQRVEESKFLGIIIDQHLTWKNHIEYVVKKIIRTTGLLCRIRFYIDQSLLIMLYNSLIYPYLHYGNIVWANNYPTRLDRLFKLQKKILRIITFSSYSAPSFSLFTRLGLLNIFQINDFLIGSFSFSLNNKVLPIYFDDFCIENARVHEHNTRESKHLHKIFRRTNYGKFSTRNKIIEIWNRIPLNIKNSSSIKLFNKRLKQFIQS